MPPMKGFFPDERPSQRPGVSLSCSGVGPGMGRPGFGGRFRQDDAAWAYICWPLPGSEDGLAHWGGEGEQALMHGGSVWWWIPE